MPAGDAHKRGGAGLLAALLRARCHGKVSIPFQCLPCPAGSRVLRLPATPMPARLCWRCAQTPGGAGRGPACSAAHSEEGGAGLGAQGLGTGGVDQCGEELNAPEHLPAAFCSHVPLWSCARAVPAGRRGGSVCGPRRLLPQPGLPPVPQLQIGQAGECQTCGLAGWIGSRGQVKQGRAGHSIAALPSPAAPAQRLRMALPPSTIAHNAVFPCPLKQAVLQATGRFGCAELTQQELFFASLITTVPANARLLRCFDDAAEEAEGAGMRARRAAAAGLGSLRGVPRGSLPSACSGQARYGPCPYPALEAFVGSVCSQVSGRLGLADAVSAGVPGGGVGRQASATWQVCSQPKLGVAGQRARLHAPPSSLPPNTQAARCARKRPTHPCLPVRLAAGRRAGPRSLLGGLGRGDALQHPRQPLVRQRRQVCNKRHRVWPPTSVADEAAPMRFACAAATRQAAGPPPGLPLRAEVPQRISALPRSSSPSLQAT